MKTVTKLICLTLLLVSIASLCSCGTPVVDTYNIEVSTDHEKSEMTYKIEYNSKKYKDVTTDLVGLQSAKIVADVTEVLPNGNNLKSVTFAMNSKIAFVRVQFTGNNEADNTIAFYRAEKQGNYVVVQKIDGLTVA